ncbi:haptoglobin-like [Phascolarctos cinereus]|uniref:Haptoglobin n=1 Tax=Phascolarctos cinereus TaxID=38626 RepID=A0A6P5ID84_PHACI|nr:haptoglobin-like [Phascolarctos cinereus]
MRILYTVAALLLCGLLSADAQNDVLDMEDDLCPKPPPIENGYAEHAVRYKCDQFYRLKSDGDGLYTLNKEKQWTNKDVGEKLPTCEAVCGKPVNPAKPVQRIIGGSLDAKGSFPWQGHMVSQRNLSSGATLISDQWLLTTAKNLFLSHDESAVLEDITPTLKLFLGKKPVAIDRVILHPNHSMVDIGLIKLKSKVLVNEKVMPICLPQKDYAEVGRVGYVSGWGRNANFAFSERLKYVMLPVADDAKCIEHYEGSTGPEKKEKKSPVGVQPILNQYTFCAGLTRFNEDTCYGDAGGAFAIHDEADDTWYAAGILSFDKSCAVAEYGVYVKVPSILDWIQETIATN